MSNDIKRIIADNLTYYLNQQGLSQQDVADALGVPKTTVSTWFRGTSLPRADKIEKLAEFFNIPYADLTNESGNRDSVAVTLSEEERTLISLYRQVKKENRKGVLSMIEVAIKRLG